MSNDYLVTPIGAEDGDTTHVRLTADEFRAAARLVESRGTTSLEMYLDKRDAKLAAASLSDALHPKKPAPKPVPRWAACVAQLRQEPPKGEVEDEHRVALTALADLLRKEAGRRGVLVRPAPPRIPDGGGHGVRIGTRQ